MRRRRKADHENHERWLVSYADFITLLFAFFVVMFATSQSDKGRVKAVSQSIEKALKDGSLFTDRKEAKAKTPDSDKKDVEAAADLSHSLDVLNASLQDEVKNKSVRLSLQRRGLIIELEAGAFFPPGDDSIGSNALPTIKKVADVLNQLPNALRLEGHTDSLPISNGRFKSNWELSAARSIAMLRFLNEKFGVSRERMAIVGYGDTGAIDTNDTEEGRERNRRVDIVVVSSYGMQAEPSQGASSTSEK